MKTHSSKNAFFKASLIGIYFTNTWILYVAFPFLWSYQVLVWHHCHQVITRCSARQSRPLPCFPCGCTFSMVTTVACCPCRLVRVTSTLAVGRVAQIAKRWLPKLFMLLDYTLWFSPKGECSPFCSVLMSCQRDTCSTNPVFSA